MDPALFRALVALAGLGLGSACGFDRVGGVLPAVGAAAAAGATLLVSRSALLRAVALAAVAFSIGFAVTSARSAPTLTSVMARSVPTCALEGHVSERVGPVALIGTDELSCGAYLASSGATVALRTDASRGSRIAAAGILVPLRGDGFEAMLRRLGAEAHLHGSVDQLPASRASFTSGYRAALGRATAELPSERSALLHGLAIGDTQHFDDRTLTMFRRAGLSHLLAVSGSNVAIVVGGTLALIAAAPLKLRVVVAAALLLVYIALVGPDASVMRAGAMGAIALISLWSGRRGAPLNSLVVAALVVVALRPALAAAVGLHLSAAATAGIILWTPRVEHALRRLPTIVRFPLAVTLPAQLAVAPLLIGTFGEISLVAPMTNLVAAPAVAPATVLALAAGVLEPVPFAGAACARLAAPFAGWIVEVARAGAGVSWASVEAPPWVALAVGLPVVVLAFRSVCGKGGGLRSVP